MNSSSSGQLRRQETHREMAMSWMSWLILIFVVEQRGRAHVFPFVETTGLVCFEWASMMIFVGFRNPRCFPVPLHRLKVIVQVARTTGSQYSAKAEFPVFACAYVQFLDQEMD
ncbi:hypothetical protein MTP99_006946 [Tenebrio molitor]|nr:hypothetical protein MTP99_006946 [Tenebrio molitor]